MMPGHSEEAASPFPFRARTALSINRGDHRFHHPARHRTGLACWVVVARRPQFAKAFIFELLLCQTCELYRGYAGLRFAGKCKMHRE
jgi:hypothetical protein